MKSNTQIKSKKANNNGETNKIVRYMFDIKKERASILGLIKARDKKICPAP